MHPKLILAGLVLGVVAPIAIAGPLVEAYKSPTCGCCTKWIDHMRSAGFEVRVHDDAQQLAAYRARLEVPARLASCHTAQVEGYYIEGHVPAADVQRLISTRPKGAGLAVAGMPIGSPGMERNGQVDAYDVLLVNGDGSTTAFARYPK
jgi:hypothetical protein